MLPSKERIHKSFFKEIFSTGKFYPGRFVNMVVMENSKNKKENSKFAFSVSKNISKNAVRRNKLRRQGYSIIKEIKNGLKQGFFVVFVLKKGSEKMTFDDYKKEIKNLLDKSKLLT